MYNLLHRLEIDRVNGKAVVLLQSTAEPKWERLVQGKYAPRYSDYFLNPPRPARHYQEFYAGVENGMRLRFRLRANPTERVAQSDTEANAKYKQSEAGQSYKARHGKHDTRRRVEVIAKNNETREERLIAWLRRKAEGDELKRIVGAGFRILDTSVKGGVPNITSAFGGKTRFAKNRHEAAVVFDGVTFDGVLEVTDAEAFRNSLVNGIGTGKAYGFGLLSIAPASLHA